jgi:enoyl-CoA hydratase/carnithine racemase
MRSTFEQRQLGAVTLLLNSDPQAQNTLTPEYYEGLRQALTGAT